MVNPEQKKAIELSELSHFQLGTGFLDASSNQPPVNGESSLVFKEYTNLRNLNIIS